jgi:type IV pilus assembly protein PilY1
VGGNLYRDRSHRLGDIVHSDPQYVGWPPFYYTLSGYQAFAQANVNRPGMIYVGGNDGMLHGFRESDGEELIAYVPNKVIGKLNRLTYTYYDHDFYVNGSPIYGDVTLNGTWRSVLIGGLREGGQGVYALDITDPENFSTSDVLWEFTDEDDADLGNVFSDVQIRKMANGKWAAVFTSGYNNTNEDGFVSPSAWTAGQQATIEKSRSTGQMDYPRPRLPMWMAITCQISSTWVTSTAGCGSWT